MSQTCPNCGGLNRATNRFCSNCGIALIGSQVVPATPGDTPSDSAPANTSPSPTSGAGEQTQPVTYVVQRWEPPVAAGTPSATPAEGAIPPPPVPAGSSPYGTYDNYGATTGQPSSERPTVAYPASPRGSVSPLAASAEARREGGTYAPYSAEAVRNLQQEKPTRTWLIPSIIGAAVLLLVLIGVGAVLMFYPLRSSNVAPATTGQEESGDLSSKSVEENIKDVIRKSNEEQITAWRNLDIEVLKGTRTGQVLTENIEAVKELKRKGMYALPENVSLEFGDITVNGNQATAETYEVWNVTFYKQSDHSVVDTMGPDHLRETYHLIKQNGKWLISSLDIEQERIPETPQGQDT
jgi:hypothetical protein